MTFEDASGQPVGNAVGRALVAVVNPGERTPFQFAGSAPAGTAKAVVSAVASRPVVLLGNHRFTTSVTGTTTDSSGVTHLVGTITNDNRSTDATAQVVFTFLDPAGQVTGVGETDVALPSTGLAPGERVAFDEPVPAGFTYAGYAALTQSVTPLWTPPKATTVQLSLAASAVERGHGASVLAQVTPPAAGRVVTLKRIVAGRLVGVVRATTNRRGSAELRTSFAVIGQVALRATVAAATGYRAGTSATVTELVTSDKPFVLPAGATLAPGSTGAVVTSLQRSLGALGYWVGTPDGYFGDSTEQAVYALQKAAGLPRNGAVGPQTAAALDSGTLPHPRSTSGQVIEVDLQRDLVVFVDNGTVRYVLNTSTGGGYTYVQDGVSDVATTPTGVFHIQRVVDGLVVDSLGSLWRPRFFYEGFALHGDGYVPPYPVSHGCVRVSNEAINWIWANNLAPIGTEVWVY